MPVNSVGINNCCLERSSLVENFRQNFSHRLIFTLMVPKKPVKSPSAVNTMMPWNMFWATQYTRSA